MKTTEKSGPRGLVQLRYIHARGVQLLKRVIQKDGQDILYSGAEQRTSYAIVYDKYTYVYYTYLKACSSRNTLVALVASRKGNWGTGIRDRREIQFSCLLKPPVMLLLSSGFGRQLQLCSGRTNKP